MTTKIKQIFRFHNYLYHSHEKLQLDRIEKAVTKIEIKKTLIEQLQTDVKEWFSVVGYTLENLDYIDNVIFKFIINIRSWRGFDRIYILGTCDEIDIYHLNLIKSEIKANKCLAGWVITHNRISNTVKIELSKNPYDIYCYTIDELIDKDIDLSKYFLWLENEVKSKGIDKYYIPLACKKESLHPKTKVKIGNPSIYDKKNGYIEGYINKWLDDPIKKHISVLGEFGTGKTWFSLHYAWLLLKKYLNDKDKGIKRGRLPIFIPLRDYAKAVNIESLISDFFFRKYNSPIPGYKAFEMLNRIGKFVIIFDGFDEMADRVDKQKMVNNFWELAKIAIVENSKIILTCRSEHFPQALEGRSLLNAELRASVSSLTGESPQFEEIELLKLDLEQIKQILSFHTNQKTVGKIIKNKALVDLAERPLMSELIIDSISDIEQGKKIDLSRIYFYAVSKKMKKDIKEERTFTSMSDKLYFMCELSWEMLSNNKMTINYKEFPDRLRTLFGETVKEQKDLDHWHYDMMGQTLLIRNDDGDYKPAHRSLIEFFVAYKFAAELGVLSPDFIEIAQDNKNIDRNLTAKEYSWQGYFKQVTTNDKNAPLLNFNQTEYKYIINNFGKEPLSKAILDLISNIIPLTDKNIQNRLLSILDYCRGKRKEEINYLANNIILLLVNYKFDFFIGKDLSNLFIQNFHFPFSRNDDTGLGVFPEQKYADFTGSDFQYSDLSNSNFGNPMYSYPRPQSSNFKLSNFSNAILDKFFYPTIQIDSITLNQATNSILVGSPDEIVVLDESLKVVKRIKSTGWHSAISPDNRYFVHSGYGNIIIRNTINYDEIVKIKISKQNNPNSSEESNLWTGGFQFSNDSKTIFTACNNSFVYIIDIKTQKEIGVLECFRSVSDISLSFNNKFLLSYGFSEYILWDLIKMEKVFFIKDKNKDSMNFYQAKFHPSLNYFIVAYQNYIKKYDLTNQKFISEFYFEGARNINFIQDRDFLLVSNGSDLGIYKFSNFKEILKVRITDLLEKEFKSFRDEFDPSSFDNFSAHLINNELILLIEFGGRMLIKYNLDTNKIIDSYLHMIDFTDTNFRNVKGASNDILVQLEKNGAIVR